MSWYTVWTWHASTPWLLLCVGKNVGLQVGGLCKLFVAPLKRSKWIDSSTLEPDWTHLKRTHIRSVSSMNSHVRSQIEVQRKSFTTAFKCTLKWRTTSRVCRKCNGGRSTWKGFSPVWTNWCLFNLLDSTNAFPHSAQTWTLGPWVCKCFLIAELSLNILVQPLWGQAIVLETSSYLSFFGLILHKKYDHLFHIKIDNKLPTLQNLPTV